jgi:hypothetical protein
MANPAQQLSTGTVPPLSGERARDSLALLDHLDQALNTNPPPRAKPPTPPTRSTQRSIPDEAPPPSPLGHASPGKPPAPPRSPDKVAEEVAKILLPKFGDHVPAILAMLTPHLEKFITERAAEIVKGLVGEWQEQAKLEIRKEVEAGAKKLADEILPEAKEIKTQVTTANKLLPLCQNSMDAASANAKSLTTSVEKSRGEIEAERKKYETAMIKAADDLKTVRQLDDVIVTKKKERDRLTHELTKAEEQLKTTTKALEAATEALNKATQHAAKENERLIVEAEKARKRPINVNQRSGSNPFAFIGVLAILAAIGFGLFHFLPPGAMDGLLPNSSSPAAARSEGPGTATSAVHAPVLLQLPPAQPKPAQKIAPKPIKQASVVQDDDNSSDDANP